MIALDDMSPAERDSALRDIARDLLTEAGDELAATLELALRVIPNDVPGRSLRARAYRAFEEWDAQKGGQS